MLSETISSSSETDGGSEKLWVNFLENSRGLWAFQSQMRGERIREWNAAQSRIYPHCQICLLFKKNQINDVQQSTTSKQSKHKQNHQRQLPFNSEKLVPEICFTKSAACKSNFLAATAAANVVHDENIDRLMQCSMCKLTVHQSKMFYVILNNVT